MGQSLRSNRKNQYLQSTSPKVKVEEKSRDKDVKKPFEFKHHSPDLAYCYKTLAKTKPKKEKLLT